jgi:hypothetical protein
MNIFIHPRPKRQRQKPEPVEFVALLYLDVESTKPLLYSEHSSREMAEHSIRSWVELNDEHWGEVVIP